MQRHASELPGALLVGVGAALDVVAGRVHEAAVWMTHQGFEWLFRLAQEPWRLTKRRFWDDPRIIAWALGARLGRPYPRRGPRR